MMIRSATALRNDYDGMVKLSTEKQEPIYLTRSGDGEMVFLPIALWEKRQAELELFADMLRREQTKLSAVTLGVFRYTLRTIRKIAKTYAFDCLFCSIANPHGICYNKSLSYAVRRRRTWNANPL